MDVFIGDKEEIAVEIRSAHIDGNKSLVGNARIWLGNNFFGTIYDHIHLNGYLLGGLFQIDTVPVFDNQQSFQRCKSTFDYLYESLSDEEEAKVMDAQSYLVNFGTLTDMFTIFSYKSGDAITITWKIRNNDEFNYNRFEDLKNYPQTVFSYTMNFRKFKQFIEDVERFILAL